MDMNKIKALSKVLTEEPKKQESKIIYGTVISSDANGVVVQLDGSDSQVLVNATTEVGEDDRVMIQVDHHEAFIVGNVSDKSVTRKTAELLQTQIDDITYVEDTGNRYLATTLSTGVTRDTPGWTAAVQSISSEKPYLWKYDIVYYSDGTSTPTDPMLIGVWSEGGGGSAGKGIVSITEHYALSTSSSTVTGTWTTSVQTMDATNRFLWNYETITYTDSTTSTTDQRVIGVYGQKGDTGTSVASVTSSKSGTVTTVTVTLSDGSSKSFQISDGAAGSNGESAAWYYGTALTHTSGTATLSTSQTSGVIVGGMYLNSQTYSVYKCTSISGTTATWTYVGNLVDGVIDNVEIGGRNLLVGTANPIIKNTRLRANGEFALVSSGDGTSSIETVNDSPVESVSVAFGILNNTANNRDYAQYQNDLENGAYYTFSAYVKGTGTLLIRHWFTGPSKDQVYGRFDISTNDWTYISRTIKLSIPSGTTAITLQFGVTGSSSAVYYLAPQLEKGNIATKWSPAPEDLTAATNGYTILWNRSAYATLNWGEAYVCAYDSKTGQTSDTDGYVMWNGAKRTVPKKMINPDNIPPYNQPIYVVLRLSSASSATGTLYMVWYDFTANGWKYAVTPTPTAVGGSWTWADSTDIILGVFTEPGSEIGFVECEVFNPPRDSKSLEVRNASTYMAINKETLDTLQTQQAIFNILTNNGQEQGLFLQNNKVYLNFSYAQGGTLKLGGASQNQYGIFELVDANDNDVILMDNTGLNLFASDGQTVVGSMGANGFRLKGSSQWDYDYSVSSNLYGTCHFNYGLAQVVDTDSVAKNFPCLTLSNDRDGSYIGTSTLHIVSTGYETWLDTSQNIVLHSAQSNTLSGDTIDYDAKMRIDKYGNTGMSADCFNQTTSIGEHSALTCIANQGIIFNAYEYGNGISGTALSASAAFDKYGLRCDSNITISNAKSFCAFSTDYLSIPLVTLSGADNIVIGQTTNQSDYGNINLRAGTKGTNTINLYGKVTTSGTVSAGGTITTSGGLYTNNKTGVSDGVAGAAVTTTGTIQLSASGTPYIYFRYDNSTNYYTRLAQTKATANRTLTMPNSTGTLATSSSDIRLKENIKDSAVKALDLIKKIKLHEFDWKEEGRGGSPHWQCGIIADELEELDIELTSGGGYNDDGSINVKSIDTLYLEGYIVKAIQEISEKIKRLEAAQDDGR